MDHRKQVRELRLLAILSVAACGASLVMEVELLPAVFIALTLTSIVEAIRLR
jgi:hypothetical protein